MRMRALAATLGPLEDKVEARISAYTDKTWAQFDTQNEELISDLKASRLAVKRARTNLWQAKMRLAEKGGWERSRRYRWVEPGEGLRDEAE